MSARCAMGGLFAAICLPPAICLFALAVHAQSSRVPPSDEIPGDRGFYLNQPVSHPEALSGVWEASDGHGGAIGIHFNLMTMLSGDTDPPIWTPQLW